MSNETSRKSLRLVCPCGYKKRLTAEFEGKKIVCPKCRNVLSVHRIKPEASLLVRCPFCGKAQDFEGSPDFCHHCKRKIEVPNVGRDIPNPVQPAPIPAPIVETVHRDLPQVFDRRTRRKKTNSNLAKQLFSLALNFLLPAGLTAIIWYSYGDKLGLPRLPFAPVEKPQVPQNMNLINPEAVPRKPRPPRLPQARKVLPKLQSPSVEILQVKHSSDHLKLSVKLDLKNLTQCGISQINFSINLKSANGRTRTVKLFNSFDEPFLPLSNKSVTLVTDAGQWDSASVTITHVAAGNQENSIVIGPVVIF